jgi:hypothetical protein
MPPDMHRAESEHGETQRHDADCLPAAVATVLSVPLNLLPEVDHDSQDWIGDYNRALSDGGWPFALITASPVPVLDGWWIAVVPSLTQPAPTKHAVVMKGRSLFWDVGRKAKYERVEPEQIKCAIYVVVVGPLREIGLRAAIRSALFDSRDVGRGHRPTRNYTP